MSAYRCAWHRSMVGAMRSSSRPLCSTCRALQPRERLLTEETAGWRAVAKDAFGSPSTEVIFTRTQDRAKVEVIFRSGELEIKR